MKVDELRSALYDILSGLNSYAHMYERLYTNERTVGLMNEFAPDFFQQHQVLLVEKIFLELAKLHDPASDRQRENISLRHLVAAVGDPKGELEEQLKLARKALGRLPVIRNKLIAHNDTEFYGKGTSESLNTVKQSIENAMDLFNKCCDSHYLFKPHNLPARGLEDFLKAAKGLADASKADDS